MELTQFWSISNILIVSIVTQSVYWKCRDIMKSRINSKNSSSYSISSPSKENNLTSRWRSYLKTCKGETFKL